MSLIRWTPDYQIGHEQIDSEHRDLFERVNRFHDAWSERHDRREIGLLLSQLIEYAERHFHNEEEIMSRASYPGLEEHAQKHEKLVEAVFALAEKLEERAFNPSHQTIRFLRSWLSDHILHDDMAYKAFLAKQA